MGNELKISYEVYAGYEDLNEVEQKLFDAATAIRKKAYAPYSRYLVGCALLLENGEIVTGNNQENAASPSGLCAERTAIFWVGANYPNLKIKKIFVIGGPQEGLSHSPAAPCGACRQSILEYENKQDEAIAFYFASTDGKTLKCASIKDLLPFSFGKSNL